MFAGGNTSSSKLTPMEVFSQDTAGKPVLYGICLQKQHLDPNHYPRKLSIKNGFRPFLYRCTLNHKRDGDTILQDHNFFASCFDVIVIFLVWLAAGGR